MSSYYLCELCDNCRQMWAWANEVDCKANHDTAKVMVDYHGKNGKRYDKPLDVCGDYIERKS